MLRRDKHFAMGNSSTPTGPSLLAGRWKGVGIRFFRGWGRICGLHGFQSTGDYCG